MWIFIVFLCGLLGILLGFLFKYIHRNVDLQRQLSYVQATSVDTSIASQALDIKDKRIEQLEKDVQLLQEELTIALANPKDFRPLNKHEEASIYLDRLLQENIADDV